MSEHEPGEPIDIADIPQVILRSTQHRLATSKEIPEGLVYKGIVTRAIEVAIEETLEQLRLNGNLPQENGGNK